MAMTLGEMLRELEEHRYDLAVWTLVENYLCKYIDQDSHRQAESGLKVRGCSENYVPSEVFERVIGRLRNEEIEPLNERIDEIESLNIKESEDDHEEDEPKTVEKQKAVKKKSGRKSRTGAKGVRSINNRTRRKGSGAG